MKPSFGALPTAGILHAAWTLDTPGFLAHDVRDLQLLYQTARPEREQRTDTGKIRIGIIEDTADHTDDPVATVVSVAGPALRECAVLKPIRVGLLEEALWAGSVIELSEFAALWRHDVRTSQMSPSARALVSVGSRISSGMYLTATRARRKIILKLDEVMRGVDVLMMPAMGTSPDTEFGLPAEPQPDSWSPDHPLWRQGSLFTAIWNVTGQPVVTIPCGLTDTGRPVVVQLIGRYLEDGALLAASARLERAWALPRRSLVPPGWRSVAGDVAQTDAAGSHITQRR